MNFFNLVSWSKNFAVFCMTTFIIIPMVALNCRGKREACEITFMDFDGKNFQFIRNICYLTILCFRCVLQIGL